MSLGDGNQNKPQDIERTVYSHFSSGNPDGIDPSKYAISFWGGLMKLSISPKIASSDGSIKYDYENNIELYLSHTRAMVLADELKDMVKNGLKCVGVLTGMKNDGLILVTDGKEIGASGPCLILMKLNENFQPISSFAYEFRKQFHFGVRDYNSSDGSFDRVYYDNLEIDQLIIALEEYYKAMVGAQAYAASSMAFKFDIARFNKNIGLVMDKLGVVQDNGSRRQPPNRSIYGNNNAAAVGEQPQSRAVGMDEFDNED